MKKGNLVKFIEWNDPHKDKVGVVLRVDNGMSWFTFQKQTRRYAAHATLGVSQMKVGDLVKSVDPWDREIIVIKIVCSKRL